jgi:hypothetical protein
VKLEPIIDMPCLLSGVWQHFAVHVFHGVVTTHDMDKMEAAGDAWLKRNPGRTIELVIIYPSKARMTTEERQRMARIIKRREKERNASATVILAEGLTGAVHRSVLTGITLLAPPPHPWKVFGKTSDAVKWIAPHVQALSGERVDPAALGQAVDDLCNQFQSRLDRG